MFINYKSQNVHFLPFVTHFPADSSGKMIPSKDDWKDLKCRPHTVLTPGINEVSDDELTVLKHHCKELIENGTIEIMELKTAPTNGKPARVAKDISEIPVAKARVLIADCINVPVLKGMLAIETRESLRIEIKDKIDEIAKREGKKEEDYETYESDDTTVAGE